MSKDLMFFLHLPKTGGSSINAMLEASGMTGQQHLEGKFRRADYLNALKTLDWVSAHIMIDEALVKAQESGRKVRMFSCVRNPLQHLISNINWTIGVLDRKRAAFYNLPDRVQLMSLEAGMVNFRQPRAIMVFLLKYSDVFLNYQSRRILGREFDKEGAPDINTALSKFEFVGTTEHLEKLAQAMGLKTEVPKENVAEGGIDPAGFQTPMFQEFFRRHNASDFKLYRAVRRKFV